MAGGGNDGTLTVAINGIEQQTVNLDNFAAAGDRADKAMGGVATASKQVAAEIEAFRQKMTDLNIPVEKINAALATKYGPAAIQAATATADLTKHVQEASTAMQAAAPAAVRMGDALGGSGGGGDAVGGGVAGAATRAGTGIRGLGRPLTTLLTQIDGAPPIVGRLSYALSSFAIGGPTTVAILAGLAAVGLAYEVLTTKTRHAQEQIDSAAKAIEHLHDKSISGPITLEINIEGAVRKVDQLANRISLLDRARAFGGLLSGLPSLEGVGNVVSSVAGALGGRSKEELNRLQAGEYDAGQQQIRDRIHGLAELASQSKATAAQIAEVNRYIAQQNRIFQGARYGTSAGDIDTANTALTEATDLRAKLDKPGEDAQKEADKAEREANRARREAANAAKRAYDSIVHAAEANLTEQARTASGERRGDRRDALLGGYGDTTFGGLTYAGRLDGEDAAPQDPYATRIEEQRQRAILGMDPGKLVASINGIKPNISKAFEFAGDKEQLRSLLNFGRVRDNFGELVGEAFGTGFTSGITGALKSGSITDGFKALTGTLLQGLGAALIQFGQAAILASSVMQAIKAALSSFLPGAGLIAGAAAVALGGLLEVAGSAFGGMGSGGTFNVASYAPAITKSGTAAGVFAQPVMPNAQATSPGALGKPAAATVVNATIIGPNDPSAQRQIVQLMTNAAAAGRTVSTPGGLSAVPG